MPADESITSSTVGQNLGAKCFYRSYNDPTNTELNVAAYDMAMCGFNKDDKAYCNVRKGDSQYTKYLDQLRKYYAQDLQCHTWADDARMIDIDCADFLKKAGPSFQKQHTQANYIVRDGGNPSVVNNSPCVRQTLTNYYWGESKSSAYLYSLVAVFGLLFA